jgi:hypothetical protein
VRLGRSWVLSPVRHVLPHILSRETPIAIFVQDQKRYLVATYGAVNWVRNLRAAGGEATLVRGQNTEKIHAIELEPESAPPIFREALRSGPPAFPP